jgi:hypothetical protein
VLPLLRAAARCCFAARRDDDEAHAHAAAAARLLVGAAWEGVQWATLCALLLGVCASWVAAARSDPRDAWFRAQPHEALPPRVARPYGGDAAARQTRAYAGFERGAAPPAPAAAAAQVEETRAAAAADAADAAPPGSSSSSSFGGAPRCAVARAVALSRRWARLTRVVCARARAVPAAAGVPPAGGLACCDLSSPAQLLVRTHTPTARAHTPPARAPADARHHAPSDVRQRHSAAGPRRRARAAARRRRDTNHRRACAHARARALTNATRARAHARAHRVRHGARVRTRAE